MAIKTLRVYWFEIVKTFLKSLKMKVFIALHVWIKIYFHKEISKISVIKKKKKKRLFCLKSNKEMHCMIS